VVTELAKPTMPVGVGRVEEAAAGRMNVVDTTLDATMVASARNMYDLRSM
jgi:hypothetical protein